MLNFEYLKTEANCHYPVGENLDVNIPYMRVAAHTLHNLIDRQKEIALVCRGTSGCMIASTVGYILQRRGRKVSVVISRKTKDSHGYNMEGAHIIQYAGVVPVVIDDFVSSGETIVSILGDLDCTVTGIGVYPYLCVANFWNYERFIEKQDKYPKYIEIGKRFNTIICNRP